MGSPNNNESEMIVAALEDQRFRWRTIKGIAAQTFLSEERVRQKIKELIETGAVIRSSVPSEDGEELYTTRDHYKRAAPFARRVLASVRNRAS